MICFFFYFTGEVETDVPNLNDVDLMELTPSQEQLLMQSLDVFSHSQSSTNNSEVNSVITSKTSTIEHKIVPSNFPMMHFQNVGHRSICITIKPKKCC